MTGESEILTDKMTAHQKPLALTDLPPRTAAIVVVVVAGDPPSIQIDLLRVGTAGDSIAARYATAISNTNEATAAFEALLAGTVLGQRQENTNLLTFKSLGTPT